MAETNNKNIVDKISTNFKNIEVIKNCTDQLSEQKKQKLGFEPYDSVINVEQKGCGISYGDSILYTYGIDTCTGVAIVDDEKSILMHLDATTTVAKVIELLSKINLTSNLQVLIFPGHSKKNGQFQHEELIKVLTKRNIPFLIKNIPSTYGYIKIDYDHTIEMVTLFEKKYFSYSNKKKNENNKNERK